MRFRSLRSILADRSAVALTEFALSLPFLMMIGLGGSELAHNIVMRKRLGEMALMVADNAARMGTSVGGSSKQVSERDINEVFLGAQIASGQMNLQGNGRVILYSLEQNASGGQWIHWGRCYGNATLTPGFTVGTGATGTSYAGMSVGGTTVTAAATTAVMVVEAVYDYQPILPLAIASYGNQRFRTEAALTVRDARDLTQVYPSTGVTASSC